MWTTSGKKPISQYLLLTFAISWGFEGLLYLGERIGLGQGTLGVIAFYALLLLVVGLAPTYAVVILLKKRGLINGFKDFLHLIFRSENTRKTVIITGIFFVILVVQNLILGEWEGNPWYYFILLIPLMILGGGLEEIGWRGFLQPALEERIPFVPATLIVGIIWAIWHFPLWLLQTANQSDMNIVSFTAHCIAAAFVLATLYTLTKSVFACIMLHAWYNVMGGMFGLSTQTDPVHTQLIIFYIIEIAVMIIVCTLLRRKQPSTHVQVT